MIKIICENYRGEKMTFSRTPKMWIESVSGLGADYEITTSKNSGQDGENYTGATASKRNIVMVLDVPKRRMDDTKDRLYSFFQPRSVGILYYYSGNIARKIRYYVESIEPEESGLVRTITISLICPDPKFYALTDDFTELAVWEGMITFPLRLPPQINAEGQSVTITPDASITDYDKIMITGQTLQTVTEQGKNLLANGNIYYTTPMPSPDAVYANGPTLGLVPHNYALAGKQVTISVDVKVTNGIARTSGPSRIGCEISFQRSDNSFFYVGVWKSVANGANFDTRISSTNTLPSDITGAIGENNFYIQCLGDVTSVGHAQLEFGSTATAYAPFVPDSPSPDYPAPISGTTSLTISDSGSNSQTVTLPQPLYSLPDGTADEYDVITGKGTQNVGKKILDGKPNWWFRQADGLSTAIAFTGAGGKPLSNNVVSSHFTEGKFLIDQNGAIYIRNFSNALAGITSNDTDEEAVAKITAWFAANPVTVLYELAEPQTIAGTAQTVPIYHPTTTLSLDAGALALRCRGKFVVTEKINTLIGNVVNPSAVPMGLTVTFSASGTVVNPSLYDVNRQLLMQVNTTMHAGDQIVITTGDGNKRVKLISGGVTSNINNLMAYPPHWLQAQQGDNLYRYNADDGIDSLSVSILSTQAYWGA